MRILGCLLKCTREATVLARRVHCNWKHCVENRDPPLAERRLTKVKQNQLWARLYLTDIWPASR